MKPRLTSVPAAPTARVYLRRSKGDADQAHSLDVQRAGSARFLDENAPTLPRVEYLDDDRAGDDFAGRAGLDRIVRDARPGDVVVCRDQSRLGRDAVEVTRTVRALVRDAGAALYFYGTGERVEASKAIDDAMTFLRGFGAQLELEAIRSRTAEALRARVRSGRLAGGRCYGYRNIQNPDPDGRRKNTRAVVDEAEAEVVRRMFAEYAAGRGHVAIAKALNAERIPSPRRAGWAPSAVRAVLLNDRYTGVYIHGRIDRPRRGGKRLTVKADPSKVIRVEVPEWRIVDALTWDAVQARFAEQARDFAATGNRWSKGSLTYPLSGIARCASCGGPITICHSKKGRENAQAYGCGYHAKRGATVCAVAIREPRELVERAVFGHLLGNVLTPDVVADITARVVQLAREDDDADTGGAGKVEQLEAELATLRAEQKRCAKLLARLDDAPEVEAEYKARQDQVRRLEADLVAAKAAPRAAELAAHVMASHVAGVIERLREGLSAAPEAARAALRALFPRGLHFAPHPNGKGWEVSGTPSLSFGLPAIATPAGFEPASLT